MLYEEISHVFPVYFDRIRRRRFEVLSMSFLGHYLADILNVLCIVPSK